MTQNNQKDVITVQVTIDKELLSQSDIQNFDLLVRTLKQKPANDQSRIAKIGLRWLSTLIRKNKDYGSSVWKKPFLAPHLETGDALLVRMSDKVERVRQLLQNAGKHEVTNETLLDSINDLGSYCLLYLARPEK